MDSVLAHHPGGPGSHPVSVIGLHQEGHLAIKGSVLQQSLDIALLAPQAPPDTVQALHEERSRRKTALILHKKEYHTCVSLKCCKLSEKSHYSWTNRHSSFLPFVAFAASCRVHSKQIPVTLTTV